MKKEEYSKMFIILCAINITCLLMSNIITVKTINIFGLIFTAGDILFPITYILNDVFTEVYGFNKSKLIIWTSFFCNLLMIIIFKITIVLPSSTSFKMQEELANILGFETGFNETNQSIFFKLKKSIIDKLKLFKK